MTMLILSIIGMVSLRLATQEVQHASMKRDEAQARHVAEAGTDLLIRWFHEPSAAPTNEQTLIQPRHDLTDSGPSFFDAFGQSQFLGTSTHPDILYDGATVAHDRLLNDPVTGWFGALQSYGRIQTMKVYAPSKPGALCTVEMTAQSHDVARTISLQLGALRLPALRAAVQIGQQGHTAPTDAPVPIWVHWGDLKIQGAAHLGRAEELATKTTRAPVTGQSYAEMAAREDRWLDLYVGGAVQFTPSSVWPAGTVPSNVFPDQEPVPGLRWDTWRYETMKRYAVLHGTYYARGEDGLLYAHGDMSPGAGIPADDVFGAGTVGHHRGLVFIDTLDQQPPGPANLGTLSFTSEYAEGLFVVNAHVQWTPRGDGRGVPALAPSGEGHASVNDRIPVTLPHIHLQGVLATPGNLVYGGQPRVYGALSIGGRLSAGPAAVRPLEVWYNHDFRGGMFRGLPLVYVVPGTWREQY